jgi:hypothetical protein
MAVVVGVVARPAQAGEVRLPDTGQTQSYTDTFGEDHDYRRPRSYTINDSKGTVIDNVTGLMWQRQDDGVARTWDAATSYCTGLTLATFTDWRLPSEQELKTLVDYGQPYSGPAIDTTVFPGTNAANYWSSTTNSWGGDYAWFVFFGTDGSGYTGRYRSYYARCVRSGQ